MAMLVSVRNVSKHYGPIAALHAFNLEMVAGEVIGILGPNGAGKTTAMEIIAGLRSPDSGSVTFRTPGLKTTENRPGYAPEEPAIWQELSPAEQLSFVARMFGRRPSKAEVAEALASLGLTGVAGRRAKHLSLGNRKRLNLALSFAHDPQLLLCDEPFSGLDIHGRELVAERIMRAAASGRAVLVASHQTEDLRRVAGRAIVLSEGQVRAERRVSVDDPGLEAWYGRVLREISP